MPEETNKFDSGHAIVPVKHPSGSVDQIAVPTGTSMEDFYGALSDAGYLHDFPTAQPSADDVLEKSPKFKEAALSAMLKTNAQSAQNSGVGLEAGFTVGNNGQPSAITTQRDVSDESRGHMRQYVGPKDFGALHTHDVRHSDTPSTDDQKAARETKKRVFVSSKSGLYEIDAQGGVTHVYKSPSWYSDKNPK
jgi:hypothetical protein